LPLTLRSISMSRWRKAMVALSKTTHPLARPGNPKTIRQMSKRIREKGNGI
ncbi:hypothetical protein CARUB_v100158151mg, partial [Capsella rubella]